MPPPAASSTTTTARSRSPPSAQPDPKRRKVENTRRRSSRLSSHSAVDYADTEPSRRRRSKDSSAVKEEASTTTQHSPHDEIDRLQKRLGEIYDRHDDRVRLLFHLEKFVSLVGYNPEEAKRDHSNVFEEYRENYDLWNKITDQKRGDRRRSTRRQVKQQQTLLDEEQEAEAEEEQRKKKKDTPPPASLQRQTKKAAPAPTKKKAPSSSSRRRSTRVKKEELSEDSAVDESESEIFNGDKIPLVTHPSHVVHQKYGGLENYLDSFVSLDEDVTPDDRDRFVDSQIDVRSRIAEAKSRGLLKNDATSSDNVEMTKFKDPTKRDTHNDYLVLHATHFSKLLNDERKMHISKARKIASMVDQYFKRLEGAEEKERKMEQKKLKQLARKTAQDVMKKWKLAEKVVQQRRLAAIEDEQRKKGKLQLNQILEQSAQLLESRFDSNDVSEAELDEDEDDEGGAAAAAASADEGSEVEADENIGQSENEEENSDELDSDEMSESDDDDEEADEENFQDKDDEKLSVEELKKKYANLPPSVSPGVDNADEDETMKIPEPNGKIQEVANDEELNGNGNASDSDESIPMDSEDDVSSDEEEEEEEGDNDEGGDESEEEKPNALAALVNGHAEESDGEYNAEEEEKSIVGTDEEDQKDADGERFKIKTAVPFLLHGNLREYQHYGLKWLAGLYKTNTNGILADEMGLGKTIQTIALITYLACEKHIWGPHLIVVPTSVMLNWEMEFKRFAPGLKVMTYYGNPQQRKDKRRGWNKEDVWHVCITSYQLVLQDQPAFRRKKWKYMILDEAHNIKNFRSQRWQALLNFNSERRLLLTGTPLQNNLMELWSLLYFLMPSSTNKAGIMPDGFANLKDFQDWFARPVDKLVEEGGQSHDDETKATVSKLHQVLRPYLLRRLKADVEKQMPAKYEHIVNCRLSKRQRFLYDDFMSRAQTKETLASGNFLSIINCLMQLRKVCNHPDLFEVRPIVTSMAVEKSVPGNYEIQDLFIKKHLLEDYDEKRVNLDVLGLLRTQQEATQTTFHSDIIISLNGQKPLWNELKELRTTAKNNPAKPNFVNMDSHSKYQKYMKTVREGDRLQHVLYLNQFRCAQRPIYGKNVIQLVRGESEYGNYPKWDGELDCMRQLKMSYDDRDVQMKEVISKYSFVTPQVVCLDQPRLTLGEETTNQVLQGQIEPVRRQPTFHESQVKLSIAFPDKRLLQYDCGKLQRLALLLRDLIDQGHRALIFTQMTKVLDILEQFLNIHGYRYLRLDGATRIEQRQVLTERFNTDAKIPVFILSTRSGGLGINLTGADTVIFYDSDWNPSMDKQCQDRCHRIGQTRDVHIYRFVSEYTIESNILRKATQKQILDNVVIQEGEFTTDYFNKLSVKDMLGDDYTENDKPLDELTASNTATTKRSFEKALAEAEDQDDVVAANVAMKEASVDRDDFEETQQKHREGSTSRATVEPESSTNNATTAAGTPTAESSTAPPAENGGVDGGGGAAEDDMEYSEDDEMGHIDDYMIRFIEAGWFD